MKRSGVAPRLSQALGEFQEVASLRLRSGRSLSSAEQRGARIEGCGVALNRCLGRTLRYGLHFAPAYSGCS
jgi:hypothetical protein